jgi:hypothetical protein
VCEVSSLTDVNATFSTLPIDYVSLKKAAMNRQRRTYYAQRCHRRLYFKRLNLPPETRKWTGGVSDSMYMPKSMVFQKMNKMVRTNTNKKPFTIVLDKGYCIVSNAITNGGHYVLQHIFGQCDQQFTAVETLVSATVANNCAENKRAVRYLKISDYISKGLLNNESVE